MTEVPSSLEIGWRPPPRPGTVKRRRARPPDPAAAPYEQAFVVGSPMAHRAAHPAEQRFRDRAVRVLVNDPCNSAHRARLMSRRGPTGLRHSGVAATPQMPSIPSAPQAACLLLYGPAPTNRKRKKGGRLVGHGVGDVAAQRAGAWAGGVGSDRVTLHELGMASRLGRV